MSQQREESEGWRPRHVLMLFTIGMTTAIVSLTAYLSYRVVRGLMVNDLHRNALLQVQQGATKIDGWLAARKAEVEAIANNQAVRSLNWSVAEPYLQLEVGRLPELEMLSIVKGDGSYYSTKTSSKTGSIPVSPFTVRENTIVEDPKISGSRQEVDISTQIWSIPPNNSPDRTAAASEIRARALTALQLLPDVEISAIGALVATVSLDEIREVVSQISFGEGSYALAIDSQGEAIFHPEVKGILTPQRSSLLQVKDHNIEIIVQQMVKDQRKIELVQLGGDWVYVAYVPLREASWSIVLVIGRQNLENKLLPLNLLALVMGVLLAVAMSIGVHLLLSSEQTRAIAEQEALLNRLTGRIRASLDMNEILPTTVAEVGTTLNLQRVVFGWNEPQEENWNIHCSYGDPQKEINILTSSDPPGVRWEENRYLALPVRSESEKLGYLICMDERRQLWSLSEKKLLQAVADQLAIAINQSRLYAQTQDQVMLLDEAIRELGRTQAHLVQSEKMSSLGQMIAGIAHEINNPVNFIYGNITPAEQYTQDLLDLIQLYGQQYPEPGPEIQDKIEDIDLDYLIEDLQKILLSMKIGTERIRDIVLSLRNFSRLDEADKKSADIHEGLNNTLLLLQHNLKDKISVVKEYGEVPQIICYPGQLNQAFMNILNNAIETLGEMEKSEKLITIKTEVVERRKGKFVRVAIGDNGPGIPKEIKNQIYDPFFTTKPVGKGTGLGLAISYQIVEEVHGGKISCKTPPEGGTTFVIEIPIIA